MNILDLLNRDYNEDIIPILYHVGIIPK